MLIREALNESEEELQKSCRFTTAVTDRDGLSSADNINLFR